jgi:hypothetical protein
MTSVKRANKLEVRSVRFNIPLLPIQIVVRVQADLRWRSLRQIRFSLRSMMLAVAVTAVCFTILAWYQAYMGQLARANNYHADQAFDPFLPNVVNRPWHAKMYNEYHTAIRRYSMIAATLRATLAVFILIFIIGRVMNWLLLRSRTMQ